MNVSIVSELSRHYLLAEWDLALAPCQCGYPVHVRVLTTGKLILCDDCGDWTAATLLYPLRSMVDKWNRKNTEKEH